MPLAQAANVKIPTVSPQLAAVRTAKLSRLEADAPSMRKLGAALIAHYLDPDRLLVSDRWSRKYAHTQGGCAGCTRPCARQVAHPVWELAQE
jgi:hypothetical protein